VFLELCSLHIFSFSLSPVSPPNRLVAQLSTLPHRPASLSSLCIGFPQHLLSTLLLPDHLSNPSPFPAWDRTPIARPMTHASRRRRLPRIIGAATRPAIRVANARSSVI
jgi:hypothetical protein